MGIRDSPGLIMKEKSKNWWKLGLVVLVLGLLVYIFRFSSLKDQLSLESIQIFLGGFGAWGPVIYILMYAILTVVFFPASILTAAGGFVYGKLWGTVYAIIGATIAAIVAFYIGRYAAKDWVEKITGKRFDKYNKKLAKRGFETVAVMRLLFLPYIPLSYAAGTSRVTIGAFVLATILTNIPGVFAFAFLGSSVGAGFDWRILLMAIVLIVLVLMIPKIVRKYAKSYK